MANEELSRTSEAGNDSVEPIMTTARAVTNTNESASVPSPTQRPSGNGDLWAQIRPHFTHISEHVKPQLDLVPKLLFALWNVSLLLGSLIFITYFASIGFMPEIDAPASITLLVVSAITGAGSLIAVGIALIAPSYIWVWWTIDYEPLKPLWSNKDGKFSHWRAKLCLACLSWVSSVVCSRSSWWRNNGTHTSSGAVFLSASVPRSSSRSYFSVTNCRSGGH
jgi:hypothetical protein